MPSRPNVLYTGNSNTYGSRGLAPSYGGGSGNVPTALAQMVATLADVATYDPATDPRAQQARLAGAQADKLGREQQAGEWASKALGDPAVTPRDRAAGLLGLNPDPEYAAKNNLLAAALSGLNPDQTMDDALASQDLMAVASGRNPNSTFSASTFDSRNKPWSVIGSDGRPVLKTAAEAIGSTPVLSKSEAEGMMLGDLAASMTPSQKLRTVGAEPLSEQVLNYTGPEGQFGSGLASRIPTGPGYAAFSGQATGTPDQMGLNKTVRSGLQESQLSLAHFNRTLGTLRGMSAEPSNFGLVGVAKDTAVQAKALLGGVATVLGVDVQSIDDAVQAINNTPVDDGTGKLVKINFFDFDPRTSGLKSLAYLAAFQGAAALADQMGRSIALPELEAFKKIVGRPQDLTMDKTKFLAGLDLLENEVRSRWELNEQALRTGQPPAPGGGLAGAAAGAVSAPPPAAAPAPGAQQPPPGAKQSPNDGQYYVPDPSRPGQYLLWTPD